MDGVQSGALVLKLAAENAKTKGSAFQLPVKELKDHVTSLTIQAGGVTLTIPVASLVDSIPEGSQKLELSVHVADASQQPADMNKQWATYSLHRVSLTVDGQQIERLRGSASMKVSVAHNLKPGEASHQAIAYSVTGGGQTEVIKNSKYVAGAGGITFTTPNFGLYVTANAGVHFSDTDSSNSIILEALAARGLVRGTGRANMNLTGRSQGQNSFNCWYPHWNFKEGITKGVQGCHSRCLVLPSRYYGSGFRCC